MNATTACFHELTNDDWSTGIFSNSGDMSTTQFPHSSWYMSPAVSSLQEMLSKMAEGSANINGLSCQTVIKTQERQCRQACKYSNGYMYMSLWSLDGNLNPDYRSTTATTAATGGGSPSTTNNSTSNKTSSSTLAVNVNHLIFSVCTVLGAALLLL